MATGTDDLLGVASPIQQGRARTFDMQRQNCVNHITLLEELDTSSSRTVASVTPVAVDGVQAACSPGAGRRNLSPSLKQCGSPLCCATFSRSDVSYNFAVPPALAGTELAADTNGVALSCFMGTAATPSSSSVPGCINYAPYPDPDDADLDLRRPYTLHPCHSSDDELQDIRFPDSFAESEWDVSGDNSPATAASKYAVSYASRELQPHPSLPPATPPEPPSRSAGNQDADEDVYSALADTASSVPAKLVLYGGRYLPLLQLVILAMTVIFFLSFDHSIVASVRGQLHAENLLRRIGRAAPLSDARVVPSLLWFGRGVPTLRSHGAESAPVAAQGENYTPNHVSFSTLLQKAPAWEEAKRVSNSDQDADSGRREGVEILADDAEALVPPPPGPQPVQTATSGIAAQGLLLVNTTRLEDQSVERFLPQTGHRANASQEAQGIEPLIEKPDHNPAVAGAFLQTSERFSRGTDLDHISTLGRFRTSLEQRANVSTVGTDIDNVSAPNRFRMSLGPRANATKELDETTEPPNPIMMQNATSILMHKHDAPTPLLMNARMQAEFSEFPDNKPDPNVIKVYVIRHAEKSRYDGKHLSNAGKRRAMYLISVFTGLLTKYQTPKTLIANQPKKMGFNSVETLTPLSHQLNLPIVTKYSKMDTSQTLYDDILSYASPILIAWEHNDIFRLATTLLGPEAPIGEMHHLEPLRSWSGGTFDKVVSLSINTVDPSLSTASIGLEAVESSAILYKVEIVFGLIMFAVLVILVENEFCRAARTSSRRSAAARAEQPLVDSSHSADFAPDECAESPDAIVLEMPDSPKLRGGAGLDQATLETACESTPSTYTPFSGIKGPDTPLLHSHTQSLRYNTQYLPNVQASADRAPRSSKNRDA